MNVVEGGSSVAVMSTQYSMLTSRLGTFGNRTTWSPLGLHKLGP